MNKKSAASKKPKRDDPAQSRRFIEAAKKAEADELDAGAADKVMGRMASTAPEPHQRTKSMTDDDLKKALNTMVSGGMVNTETLEALHERGFIRELQKGGNGKRSWEMTDEGKAFAGLAF